MKKKMTQLMVASENDFTTAATRTKINAEKHLTKKPKE